MAISGNVAVTGGGDRLSALPDCLLHEIMSRMKARQVAQTCVLSTRWRHLWLSVPCLNIDDDEFKTRVGSNERWENFEDFTDNLLCRLNIATLDSFSLCLGRDWSRRTDFDMGLRWIRRGIKYCAQGPGIHRDGLSSRSWRLRRLHLSRVRLDDRFAKHVTSGCHFLEDLVLEHCVCEFPRLASRTLKNLVLDGSYLSEVTAPTLKSLVIHGDVNTALVVMVPALAYLHLAMSAYRLINGFSLKGMSSLSKASIHLGFWVPGEDAKRKLRCHQVNFLRSVSNVTCLELSGFETMAVGKGHMKFPRFKNLRTLLLNKCDISDNLKTLGHFVKNSPNLEKLTLRLCRFSKNKEGRMSKSNNTTSSQCQCENLKLTEIIYQDDDASQLVDLLSGILGNLPKNHVILTKVD
ncbi:hypothetical protein ACP70R_029984 [Stipagrostis hirtigluma subsp. patula]